MDSSGFFLAETIDNRYPLMYNKLNKCDEEDSTRFKTFRDAAFGASRSESYGEHHFGAGNPNYSKIVRFANVNRSQSWAVANSGGTAEIFRPVFYRTFFIASGESAGSGGMNEFSGIKQSKRFGQRKENIGILGPN
jgi:hypothetical protein